MRRFRSEAEQLFRLAFGVGYESSVSFLFTNALLRGSHFAPKQEGTSPKITSPRGKGVTRYEEGGQHRSLINPSRRQPLSAQITSVKKEKKARQSVPNRSDYEEYAVPVLRALPPTRFG